MLIDEILQGESSSVEFKERLPEKSSKYMKTVVAFANGRGGRIYFGVRDEDHAIVGIPAENLFPTMDAITTAISDSCEPTIFPDVSSITIDEKHVIVVDIQPGRQRPYYLKSKGITNGVYVRVSGTTRIADRSYIQELLLEDSHRFYDQLPADYEVTEEEIQQLCQSLQQTAMQNAADKSRSVDVRPVTTNTLLSWGVLVEQDKHLRPTHAFSMLSGNERYFSMKVQCGVFRGTTRALLVSRQEFSGPVQQQVRDAYEYVLSKLGIRTEIKGLYRQDTYEFPKESLREAIVNAVVHRSYIELANITIFLYDDRLEITSPGGLLQTVTIKRMKEGYSKIRNRALTYAFIYMNLIDQYGSGIPRILEEFRQSGLHEPEFIDMESDFRIVFKRPLFSHDTKSGIDDTKTETNDTKNDPDDTNHDTKRDTDDTDHGTNDTNNTPLSMEEKICMELRKNPAITQKELSAILSISETTLKRMMKKMRDKKQIDRRGARRSGVWVVLGSQELE